MVRGRSKKMGSQGLLRNRDPTECIWIGFGRHLNNVAVMSWQQTYRYIEHQSIDLRLFCHVPIRLRLENKINRRTKWPPSERVEEKQKATQTKNSYWYQTQGPGWMAQTPRAGTGNSASTSCTLRYLWETPSVSLGWVRCLLITESPKTPSHYRYQF